MGAGHPFGEIVQRRIHREDLALPHHDQRREDARLRARGLRLAAELPRAEAAIESTDDDRLVPLRTAVDLLTEDQRLLRAALLSPFFDASAGRGGAGDSARHAEVASARPRSPRPRIARAGGPLMNTIPPILNASSGTRRARPAGGGSARTHCGSRAGDAVVGEGTG